MHAREKRPLPSSFPQGCKTFRDRDWKKARHTYSDTINCRRDHACISQNAARQSNNPRHAVTERGFEMKEDERSASTREILQGRKTASPRPSAANFDACLVETCLRSYRRESRLTFSRRLGRITARSVKRKTVGCREETPQGCSRARRRVIRPRNRRKCTNTSRDSHTWAITDPDPDEEMAPRGHLCILCKTFMHMHMQGIHHTHIRPRI